MIRIFKPKSKILQNYVDLFYVLNNKESEKFSYAVFPHIDTCMSFIKGAEITRSNFQVNILANNKSATNECIEVIGKYTNPVFVNYSGKIQEVSVIFKPLGINHFFNEDLKLITPDFSQSLNLPDWDFLCHKIFKTQDDLKKIELIEGFLLDNLLDLNFDKLYKAQAYLEDIENDYSIEDVAELIDLNLKTFQRLFSKHLACSPLEYKRIARFRQSLNVKLLSKEIKSLTEVSYESNFYDQSYFIREFKKLTKLNPRKFFESISILDEEKIIWSIK